MDAVFKALADESRRKLLDVLRKDNGLPLGELCEHLDMSRQAVTKHLRLLEADHIGRVLRTGHRSPHIAHRLLDAAHDDGGAVKQGAVPIKSNQVIAAQQALPGAVVRYE